MSLSRRTILGALTAAAGLGSANEAAADDNRVTTRHCDDRSLEPGEWATSAVTVTACPSADMATVDISSPNGRVSRNRHPDDPSSLRTTTRVFIDPGQRTTVWCSGSVTVSCSNDAVNVGIANRPATNSGTDEQPADEQPADERPADEQPDEPADDDPDPDPDLDPDPDNDSDYDMRPDPDAEPVPEPVVVSPVDNPYNQTNSSDGGGGE